MKKPVRVVLVILVVLAVAIGALAFAVKTYLTSDRLKAAIIPRAEAVLGRQVGIGSIDVSIFKGIVVSDISISEASGKEAFIKIDKAALRFKLPPLLRRELIINSAKMSSPSIRIVRLKNGKFNYSDILDRLKSGKSDDKDEDGGGGGIPLSIVTDRIAVSDAEVTFVDMTGKLPDTLLSTDIDISFATGLSGGGMNAVLSLNGGQLHAGDSGLNDITADIRYLGSGVDIAGLGFTIQGGEGKSLENGLVRGSVSFALPSGDEDAVEKITKSLTGKITLSDIVTHLGQLKAETSGDVNIKEGAVNATLKTVTGADTIRTNATLNSITGKRQAALGIHADTLDIDRIISALDGQKTAGGEKREASSSFTPPDIAALGEVTVGKARFRGFDVKDFLMKFAYSDGIVKVEPMEMQIVGGKSVESKGSLEGAVDFRLQPNTPPAMSARKSLNGQARARLSKGRIKPTPLTEGLAAFTGIEELRNPEIDEALISLSMNKGTADVDGYINSRYMMAIPGGKAELATGVLDITLDMKLAPSLTKGMLPSISAMNLFKDKEGWTTLPLAVTGTLDKPKFGINKKAVGKKAKEAVTKEIEKRIMERLAPQGKDEGEENKGISPQDLLKGIFGK